MTTPDMRLYSRYCEVQEPDFKDPKKSCDDLNKKNERHIEDDERYFIVVSDKNLCFCVLDH